MGLDINYFRSIQGAMGLSSPKDVKLEDIKSNLISEFENSINCENDSLINGIPQKLQVVPTKRKDEYVIKSKPNETFKLGDEITCFNQKWLVTDKYANEQIQSSGTIKQCNHLFRFQNFNSTIHQYWGILEIPSTTLDNGTIITSPSNKMKAYLPYNEYTKDIFIGKRLMTDVIKNDKNKDIGEVYVVTGFNGKSNHYGDNRLLVLNLESGSYNSSVDNMTEMICDYITETTPSPSYDCELTYYGLPEIKFGGSTKTITAVFKDAQGGIYPNVNPKWEITPNISTTKIQQTIDNLTLKIKVLDQSVVGEVLTIKCTDLIYGAYSQIDVKVVNSL